VPKRRTVDLFPEFGVPPVECGLQCMSIPRDDEISDECKRAGLRRQLFGSSTTSAFAGEYGRNTASRHGCCESRVFLKRGELWRIGFASSSDHWLPF